MLCGFWSDWLGNFGMMIVLLIVLIIGVVGFVIDIINVFIVKVKLQGVGDVVVFVVIVGFFFGMQVVFVM